MGPASGGRDFAAWRSREDHYQARAWQCHPLRCHAGAPTTSGASCRRPVWPNPAPRRRFRPQAHARASLGHGTRRRMLTPGVNMAPRAVRRQARAGERPHDTLERLFFRGFGRPYSPPPGPCRMAPTAARKLYPALLTYITRRLIYASRKLDRAGGRDEGTRGTELSHMRGPRLQLLQLERAGGKPQGWFRAPA